MTNERVFAIKVAVYPLYVPKAERKNHTKEEVEMQKICYPSKLIDELAKGRAMEKILRVSTLARIARRDCLANRGRSCRTPEWSADVIAESRPPQSINADAPMLLAGTAPTLRPTLLRHYSRQSSGTREVTRQTSS